MSMADKRDKTSYIINNTIKKLLNDNGYMLNRNKTKSWDGQWLYNINKCSLAGVKKITHLTRYELLDAYDKGILIKYLESMESQ